jgi:hypothetical protein
MYNLEQKDVEQIDWLLNMMPYGSKKEVEWIKAVIYSKKEEDEVREV